MICKQMKSYDIIRASKRMI